MSASRQHTVWCDTCSTWEMISSSSATQARKLLAEEQGWTRRPNAKGKLQDVCPLCKKHQDAKISVQP